MPSDRCSSHLPSSPRTSKSSAQTFHRVSTTITTSNRNLSVSLVKNFRAARTWHLEQVAGVLPDAVNLVAVAVLDTARPLLLSAQNHQPEQLQQEPNFTPGPLEARAPILCRGMQGGEKDEGPTPGCTGSDQASFSRLRGRAALLLSRRCYVSLASL